MMFKVFNAINYILIANIFLFTIGYAIQAYGSPDSIPVEYGVLILLSSKFAIYYPFMLIAVVSFAYYKAKKETGSYQHPKYIKDHMKILKRSRLVIVLASVLNLVDTVYVGSYQVFGTMDIIINLFLMGMFISMCYFEIRAMKLTQKELKHNAPQAS